MMKKLSIIAQWIAVAGLVVFVAVVMLRKAPRPDYAPDTWHNWGGVTVLSYPGIARSDSPDYPSAQRLEAHLTALRDAGYRTVRSEDVRAFLDKQAPLPPKALLLIFEGGRKEAFIRATPVLQRTGFMAVIAVPTTVFDQWGGFYLRPKDIRRVVRLPQWQVGSMGHAAIRSLAGAGKGTAVQRFLTHRAVNAGVVESSDAFSARVVQDYARSASLLQDATGEPPRLYLYPFGDAGLSPSDDPLAEGANRDGVTRYYSLAFSGSARAFNGPGSDPWSLSRLRVPGDWSADRLLAELAASQPRRTSQETLGTSRVWTFERDADLRDAALRLPDHATAWLRGTENWSDVEITATLQPEGRGAASLYARHASPRSWLRVTVDANGLRVQERLDDSLLTLFRHPTEGLKDVESRVRLRLRYNRAWVWLNDEPLAVNVPLAQTTRRGGVGLGSERGETTVNAFSARPLPARWLLANSIRLVPEGERDWVQAVLPNWFRAGTEPMVAETALQDILQAAVSGIRTLPLLSGADALDDQAARDWAAAIDDALEQADLKALTPVLAVEGPALALVTELRNRNYRIVHLLSAAQALEWGRSLPGRGVDDIIAVNDRGPEADAAIDWLAKVIPASRLARREELGDAFGDEIAVSLVELNDQFKGR